MTRRSSKRSRCSDEEREGTETVAKSAKITNEKASETITEAPSASQLRDRILEMLDQRSRASTMCPSEVARSFYKARPQWYPLMEPIRKVAKGLVDEGTIYILQKNHEVDIDSVKGPIRLKYSDMSQGIKITVCSPSDELWVKYSSIPISFLVHSQLVVSPLDQSGLSGLQLKEEVVTEPWLKEYDLADEGPLWWHRQFDVSRWVVLFAYSAEDSSLLGCALVAFDTAGVHMLEERKDLAVLWDIRVHPLHRSRGIGRVLFQAAESWARDNGCRELKVETQNINVPACKFYARQGCVLRTIRTEAYMPQLPNEVQLLWYKNLSFE